MPRIILKSLTFDAPPFRKLGGMRIDFAPRITLIAGHNGIGKSTILGLAANGSGLRSKEHQSYLNRAYQAFLNEIVHLDFEREFNYFKQSKSPLPVPYLEYDVDGDLLTKKCSTTPRDRENKLLRVVPRNDPWDPFESSSGIQVGRDQKVPLPTLYLGMTRMLPVGESNPDWIVNDQDTAMHADDVTFIETFIGSVIQGATPAGGTHTITTQTIKGTNKTAKHPEYSYSPKCVSLGQDSLSSIATAVASFQKLKREMPDYPGGVLVIDELDAGFHPHAQAKLAKVLKTAARKLDLQVVATTHSMSLIEAVWDEGRPGNAQPADAVIYLVDTTMPRVATDYGIEDIRRDMQLLPPVAQSKAKPKSLKVYLEDEQASFVLEKILTSRLKRRIKQESGVILKLLPVSLGGLNLMALHKHDPNFKTVLIALDADSPTSGSGKAKGNILKLPGGKDQAGASLSPERTIYYFVKTLSEANDLFPHARAALAKARVTSNYLNEHLLSGDTNITDRNSAKKWFNNRLSFLKDWKIIELWMAEHKEQMQKFEDELVAAAKAYAGFAN